MKAADVCFAKVTGGFCPLWNHANIPPSGDMLHENKYVSDVSDGEERLTFWMEIFAGFVAKMYCYNL